MRYSVQRLVLGLDKVANTLTPNGLLPMRSRCRGCCLSRSAVPENWGKYDLFSVPRRTGEMRLTVVVARAQCAEFLTRRHILSMKRGNDQCLARIRYTCETKEEVLLVVVPQDIRTEFIALSQLRIRWGDEPDVERWRETRGLDTRGRSRNLSRFAIPSGQGCRARTILRATPK